MDCPKFKEMKMTSWKRTKPVEIAKDVRLDDISIRMGAVKDYEGLDDGWMELNCDVCWVAEEFEVAVSVEGPSTCPITGVRK